jgi:hypothetical protein
MTLMRTNGHAAPEITNGMGELLNDLRESPSALEAITRAEIDVQINTAKHFPRDFGRFMRTAKAMVECDPDLAAQCTYILPARKGSSERISGPSVRLAEIVAGCWGNLRIGGRMIDDDGKFITVQGVAHDLETNVAYAVEAKVGVTYSANAKYNAGGRYGDDMIRTTANAAIAKVTRNATFKVVPRAFVSLVQDHADHVARGDVKSLPARTDKAIGWFAGKGVAEAKVLAALGITSRDEMSLETLQTLNGFKTAVNEGHASLAEIFSPAPAPPAAEAPAKSSTLAEKIATTTKAPKKTAAAPEPTADDGDPDTDIVIPGERVPGEDG